MKNLKVSKVTEACLVFNNGMELSSRHVQSCCEDHYLDFSGLSLADFDGLEFDLSNDDFFERIEGYGIALKPINGLPVRIPGYGSNNGYYSSNLSLVVMDGRTVIKSYDIEECQDY